MKTRMCVWVHLENINMKLQRKIRVNTISPFCDEPYGTVLQKNVFRSSGKYEYYRSFTLKKFTKGTVR